MSIETEGAWFPDGVILGAARDVALASDGAGNLVAQGPAGFSSLAGSASLTADQAWTGSNIFTKPIIQRTLGGTAIIAKALGDGQSGVQYWKHDDTTGYLVHLLAGPNSGASTYLAGFGTDDGSGGALIASLKNAGKGITIFDNPSHTDWSFYLAGYNKTADPFRIEQFVGSPGAVIATMDGEGFYIGVATTAGSPNVAVPGATLTGADIGRGVKQLTSKGEANPFPAGATIAAVTDGNNFVMSVNATATVTNTNLQIAGRPSPAAQPILRLNQNANNWMKFSPTTSEIRSLLNVIGGLGTLGTAGVNDFFLKASTGEFRAYQNVAGTSFRRHDVLFSNAKASLIGYPAAARGSESGPVTGFSWNDTGIGFFTTAPVAKQALAAAATDAATTQTLVNSIRSALVAYGLA